MKIKDKVIVVTGGANGIGEAMARRFHAEGAKAVVVADRDFARAQMVASEIGGLAVACDVSVEADAAAAVADTVAHFDRLDILVNSAGVNEAGGIESLTSAQWQRVIDINLMGTIHACRAAFPVMKAQGSGDIVNISSTAGRRSGWRFAAYSTSKFGLTGFTESLRQEGGQAGIRVSIIEPGATATEIASSISDPQWRDMIQQHTHKDGAMAPDDIVAGILLAVSLPRRANLSRILIQPTIDTEPMP